MKPTIPDRYTQTARLIYAELQKRAIPSVVDWRACEEYNLAASELPLVVAASRGHLRLRSPGILEIVPPPPPPLPETPL